MVQLNGTEMLLQRSNCSHRLNGTMTDRNNSIYEYERLYNMHININMQYLDNRISKSKKNNRFQFLMIDFLLRSLNMNNDYLQL